MTETKSESLRAAIVKAAVDRLAGYRLQQGIFGDTAAQLVADAIMPIIQASDLPPSEGGRGEVIADAADVLRSLSCELMNKGKPSERYYNLAVRLEALASAPVSPMGSGGWQTIDSAPTDGMEVDVWLAPLSETGDALIPCRVPDAFYEDGAWYWRGSGDKPIRIWHRITHWKPKPAPPLSALKGEGQ